jgi:hypothetical protein
MMPAFGVKPESSHKVDATTANTNEICATDWRYLEYQRHLSQAGEAAGRCLAQFLQAKIRAILI